MILWVSVSKRIFFQRGKLVERLSFLSIYETCMIWERWFYSCQENHKMIFSLAWNIMFTVEYHVYWLLKNSCFEFFGDGKYDTFLSQKFNGNIFTDYWKVFVFNFSEIRNTVFFSAKEFVERWYLFGLFELSMIF